MDSSAVVEKTVPPSIRQVKEFVVVDEAQSTDLPSYPDSHIITDVEYQAPQVLDEDNDMEDKHCIGNNDEEFYFSLENTKGFLRMLYAKHVYTTSCTEAVTMQLNR